MNRRFPGSTQRFRRGMAFLLAIFIAFAAPAVALAHPLGNFTINHYAGLNVGRDTVAIDYVLDMAEIPAFQEIAAMGGNGSQLPATSVMAAYHPTQCEAIRSQLDLRLDGRPVAIALNSSSIDFPPGAGGLPTLRLTCAFSASNIVVDQRASLEFKDNSYADRIGWREITVAGDGVSLQGNFAATSVSRRLTAYPNDMLANPLDQREVSFSFTPTSAPGQSLVRSPGSEANPLSSNRNDAFTQLISMPDLGPGPIVLALLVAFVWGAMHAFSPGHGKTIVAAYLVGSRAAARHALFLGLTTTATHTAGVFVLGLLTLFASHYIVPEQLYPWLEMISGLLVVVIGASLIASRWRKLSNPNHSHSDHGPDHEHEHDHTHAHDDHHDHTHPAGHTHSHLPLDVEGAPITWRGLLALGITGGLLPCPSALVVMLGAIALNRVGFGLLLIVVFSMGLAGTLTAIGVLMVRAKGLIERLTSGGRLFGRIPISARLIQVIPAVSAVFIMLAGVGITLTALAQTGVFRL